jgi:hypothetical protein
MSKVLDLLKEKNFYLERFLEESRKEKTSFKARRFDNLDTLYKMREEILLNIQSIDERIKKECALEASGNLEPPKNGEVRKMLDQIKTNVTYILEEDLQIISCIEDEKSKIIREISSTREGKKALKGYRAI